MICSVLEETKMGMDNKEYLNDVLSVDDLDIPCPLCGGFIPMSMHQLIYSDCLFCPTCGFKLEIDKRKQREGE